MSDGTYPNLSDYVESIDLGENASVEAARNLIDQKILKLEADIRNLKSRRNDLAPTSILPPEILSKIFLAYASISYPDLLGWITATHVSRHWRAVALNSPSLWTNILFFNPTWANEMLKRSKSAPISIKVFLRSYSSRISDVVRTALSDPTRIQVIDISGDASSLRKVFEDPPHSAPLLRVLALSADGTTNFYSSEPLIISDQFLHGDTSSLRRLELKNCDISWKSSLFCNLTFLKVHTVSPSARSTTLEMLEALQKNPALETLDLHKSLPALGSDFQVCIPNFVVNLPSLNSLRLGGTAVECHNILNHISIPGSANVSLSCNGTDKTNDDFSQVLSALSRSRTTLCLSGAPPPLRSLHLMNTGASILVLEAWPTVTLSSISAPAPASSLSLNLSWTKVSTPYKALSEVCKSLSLTQLVTLRVSDELNSQAWINIFSHLPALRNIQLVAPCALPIIDALRNDPAFPPSEDEKQETSTELAQVSGAWRDTRTKVAHFPSLRRLSFYSVDFDEDRTEESEAVERLADSLIYRYEFGAEMLRLRIIDCYYIHEHDVDELREISDDVEWDGIEQEHSEDEEEEDEDNSDYFDDDDNFSDGGLYW